MCVCVSACVGVREREMESQCVCVCLECVFFSSLKNVRACIEVEPHWLIRQAPKNVSTNGRASKSRGSIARGKNFWQEIVLEAKCRFVRRTFDDVDDDGDDDDGGSPEGTLKFSRKRLRRRSLESAERRVERKE